MNDSLAIYLSQALEDDCDKRSKIQKDVITKFLKEQSDFGAFLPKGLVSQTFVDDLHLLRDRCKFQFVNKDQKIFSKGEYMDSCYIIIQGNVVCETEKVGVNRKDGNVLGEEFLLNGIVRWEYDAFCSTDVLLCSISVDAIMKTVGISGGTGNIVDPKEYIPLFWNKNNLLEESSYSACTSTAECTDISSDADTRDFTDTESQGSNDQLLPDTNESTSKVLSIRDHASNRKAASVSSNASSSVMSGSSTYSSLSSPVAMIYMSSSNSMRSGGSENSISRELQDIISNSRSRMYKAGELIFDQSQSRYNLFIIVRGECKLYRSFPQRIYGDCNVPSKIDVYSHLGPGDYSFMDGESIRDWLELRRKELAAVEQNANAKDSFKSGRAFGTHKNCLLASTPVQVLVVSLFDIYMSSRIVFEKLFNLAISRFPRASDSDEDILQRYIVNSQWENSRGEVLGDLKGNNRQARPAGIPKKPSEPKMSVLSIRQKKQLEVVSDGCGRVGTATALMTAVTYGNVETVKFLLDTGLAGNLDLKNELGFTALIQAVYKGFEDIGIMLVDAGCNMDTHTDDGCNALIKSCNMGRVRLGLHLIAKGAAVDEKSKNGNTGLMKACEKGHYELAEALVNAKATINFNSGDGCCPLIRATNYGHHDIVVLLLEHGANINIKSLRGGNTALIKAADKGFFETAQLLVDKGINLDIANNSGETAIVFAVKNGHYDIADMLAARQKLNLSMRGYSLIEQNLLKAVKAGDEKTAVVLISNGANLEVGYEDGCNPLIKSSNFGYEKIALALIDNGADVNRVSRNGNSALMKAVEHGFINIAKALVNRKACLDVHSNDGCCPLIRASNYVHENCVRLLVESGCDINIKSKSGNTALHKAAEKGSLEICKFLMANDIVTNHKNNKGETPFSLAQIKGHSAVVALFREHDAQKIRKINSLTLQASRAESSRHMKSGSNSQFSMRIASKDRASRKSVAYGSNSSLVSTREKYDEEDEEDEEHHGPGSRQSSFADMHKIGSIGSIHGATRQKSIGIIVGDVERHDSHGTIGNHSSRGRFHHHGSKGSIMSHRGRGAHKIKCSNNSLRELNFCDQGLWDSINCGDEETAVDLIEIEGADVNLKYEDGSCPLVMSCERGFSKIVDALIQNGVDVNRVDKAGCNGLMKASEKGFFHIAKALVAAGCLIDVHSNDGCCPLIRASNYGHPPIVRLLVNQAHCNVNIKSMNGNTALHKAAQNGFSEIANTLVKHKANLEITNNKGESALQIAVDSGHSDVAEIIREYRDKLLRENVALLFSVKAGDEDVSIKLIENGANLDVSYEDGCCPIIKSSNFGYERIVMALIKHGADLNRCSKNGNTALMKAVEKGYFTIAKALVDAKALIDVHSNDGCCPLIRASNYGHFDCVKLLVENGANINIISKRGGNTALHKAAEKGSEDIAQILIEHGINLDIANANGDTALNLSVRHGHIEISRMIRERQKIILGERGYSLIDYNLLKAVKANDETTALILISNGANLEVGYEDGCNPLIKSSNFGYEKIALALIDNGADVNRVSRNGNSALMKAVEHGFINIAKYLLEHHALVNVHSNDGCCPLVRAANYGRTDCLRLLIEHGANVDICSKGGGNSALHKAAEKGYEEMVFLLMEAECKLFHPNKKGETPLDLASANNHPKIVKMISEAMQKTSQEQFLSNAQSKYSSSRRNMSKNMSARGCTSKNSIGVSKEDLRHNHSKGNMNHDHSQGYIDRVDSHGSLHSNGSRRSMHGVESRFSVGSTALHGVNSKGSVGSTRNGSTKGTGGVGACSTVLLLAVQMGDCETAVDFINEGADLNLKYLDGCNPLVKSADYGYVDIVDALVQNGMDINVRSKSGNTALMKACEKGWDHVVDVLLDMGAATDVMNNDGCCAVVRACNYGHFECIRLLLENKASINIKSRSGNTGLHKAALHGFEDIARLLVDEGINLAITNKAGESALAIAAQHGRTEIAALIRAKMLEVNVPIPAELMTDKFEAKVPHVPKPLPPNLFTAKELKYYSYIRGIMQSGYKVKIDPTEVGAEASLLLSVHKNDYDTALTFIEAGVNLNISFSDGCCPIIHSSNYGYEQLAMKLIEMKCDLDRKSKNGNTALMKACEKGFLKIAKALVDNKATIEIHSNDGCCPLIRASNYGHEACVRMLLLNGAKVNITSLTGKNTALHKAAEKGYDGICKVLLDRGISIDHLNAKGETAMSLALANGHKSVVKLIKNKQVERGHIAKTLLQTVKAGDERTSVALIKNTINTVDLDLTYEDGCCPIIKSSNFGYESIVMALIAQGANIQRASKNGNTALMKAVEKGYFTIAKALVDAKALIDVHSNDGCCPLIRASNYGHFDCVKLLVENGASINIVSKNGNTALHKAAEKGFSDIASYLIKNNIILDFGNSKGETPIDLAVRNGHSGTAVEIREKILLDTKLTRAVNESRMDDLQALIRGGISLTSADGQNAILAAVKQGKEDIAVLLIDSGANFEVHYEDGCAPIIKSANYGYEKIVTCLLAHGCNVNRSSNNGNTPLMKAVEHGFAHIAKLLLDAKAEINVFNKDGCSTLIRASNYGHLDCVRLLIESGRANIDIQSRSGNTALHKACLHNSIPIVKYLLSKHANLTLKNGKGETALDIAKKGLHEESINLVNAAAKMLAINRAALLTAVKAGDEVTACQLINTGINLDLQYEDGCNPLIKSANFGYEKIALTLIARGMNVNMQSAHGNTALMKACEHGNFTIARALVDAKADIDIHNHEGCCPLIRASNHGHEKIVALLVNSGRADIDIKSNSGNTALHKAAQNGFEGIAKLLIDHGIKLGQANNNGLTAHALALRSHHEQIAHMIKSKVDELEKQRESKMKGFASLMKACEMGNLKVATNLLAGETKNSINEHNHEGCCPLIRSSNYGHEAIVRLLVEANGCDINIRSKSGNSALHKAAEKGFDSIARFLLDKGIIPDAPNNAGITPLEYANKSNHTVIAGLIKAKLQEVNKSKHGGINIAGGVRVAGGGKVGDPEKIQELKHALAPTAPSSPPPNAKGSAKFIKSPAANHRMNKLAKK